MSNRNVKYHRLEDYAEYGGPVDRFVVCSFKTLRLGILQVRARYTNKWKISTPKNEPDLNMMPPCEQEYVKRVCAIVYRLVYHAPAKTERFEVP